MAFIKNTENKPAGLTYGDILDRFALLNNVKDLPRDKLCFARSKNLLHLRAFEKRNSPAARIPLTTDFENYQKEFSETRGKYLLTDKEGKAVLHDNNPVVDIANPELVEKMTELKQNFRPAIQEREDDLKAYNEFMLDIVPEDVLPKIHFVNMENVAGLTQDQVEAVLWFVNE